MSYLYAVMHLVRWEDLRLARRGTGQELPFMTLVALDDAAGMVGFLPVFDNVEEANAWAEGKWPVAVLEELSQVEVRTPKKAAPASLRELMDTDDPSHFPPPVQGAAS